MHDDNRVSFCGLPQTTCPGLHSHKQLIPLLCFKCFMWYLKQEILYMFIAHLIAVQTAFNVTKVITLNEQVHIFVYLN